MELKTPLYDCHVALNGKIVPFAGYLLPVQYDTGVIAEHMAVRTKAGLFDVSHMGEVVFSGPDALKNVQHLMTNDFGQHGGRQMSATAPCATKRAAWWTTLIVYCLKEPTDYLVVVNAANRHKDADWMRSHLIGDVTFKDISDRGGPRSPSRGPSPRPFYPNWLTRGTSQPNTTASAKPAR